MLAPAIMIQGTASSVGKSLLVTALCRIFAQRGLRVAPFKAQNMALNAAVTLDGLEIGRAQAVQAEAAGVAASADMNPILLKPEGDRRAQVIVNGRPVGSLSAAEYHAEKPALRGVVAEALGRLRAAHDLVVIEGAGSPAEINLRDRDLVNMHVAKTADAPVLLAGDIDRGGVFAAFVGTLELLEPDERPRIAAFIVNKFRGDLGLLRSGLDYLEARTGRPVLGVVPYLPSLRIADEDSASLDARQRRPRACAGELEIAVVRLPRLANYDDFEALEHEAGVVVRFVEQAAELEGADLVVLPGSKATVLDLAWLRAGGLAEAVLARAARGDPVLGICGGCQMLGARIEDPQRVESAEPAVAGLGLLPLVTRFREVKTTARVHARPAAPSFLTPRVAGAAALEGYEIHMGDPILLEGGSAAFTIEARNGRGVEVADGAVAAGGAVVGTMIHGILDDGRVRAALLQHLRERRGLPPPGPGAPAVPSRAAEFDRLAAAVEASLDRDLLFRLAGHPGKARPICR